MLSKKGLQGRDALYAEKTKKANLAWKASTLVTLQTLVPS